MYKRPRGVLSAEPSREGGGGGCSTYVPLPCKSIFTRTSNNMGHYFPLFTRLSNDSGAALTYVDTGLHYSY